jgi:Septum formation
MSRAQFRAARWFVLFLVTIGLLSGCGGSANKSESTADAATSTTRSAPGHATHSHSPEPPPVAPETAECRTLTYRDISGFFDDTKTTSCSASHTAYTFAVVQLPKSVAFDGVKIQNDAVQTAAADRCRAAFKKFIGGNDETRALARLTVTYFLPHQIGFDRGAHWVRCDVVALQSARMLAQLPRRLQGLLDSSSALSTYGVCSRADPGSSPLVMCSQPHAYRALAAIRLGDDAAPYPGQQATVDLGTSRCKTLVAKQLGVKGGFTYSWTYPSTADWAAGQRFGYCWNQTTS